MSTITVKAHPPGGVVALLSWAHFLNDGAANYLPGVLPAVLAALVLPIRDAGLIMGILIAFQALQPIAGVLADQRGARFMIIAGLAGSSLGAAWIGWASSGAALVSALVLIGICNTILHPPALAISRRVAAGRGEQATALFLVGGEIGRGAWPLFAGILVTTWGLHSLWVLSLAAIPTLPLLWLRVPHYAPARSRLGAWRGVREAGRPLVMVIVYSALRSTQAFGVTVFVPLLWHERGGSLAGGAGLITTMLVVGIVGNLGGASLARRWGKRPLVIAGSLAFTILLACFLLASGIWLWITMALLGIAVFGTLPLTVLMCQDQLPQQHSLASGIGLGFSNALGAGLVAILGLLAAVWGPQGVLWSFVASGALAFLFSFALPSSAPSCPRQASKQNPSNS
ncbi:MAG: MFS transporter [Terriglobales bacterium]